MKKFLFVLAAVAAALAFVGCDKEEFGSGDNGGLDGTIWIRNVQGEKSVVAFDDGKFYLYMNINEQTGEVYDGAMTGTYGISGSSIKMNVTWVDGADDEENSQITSLLKLSGKISGNKIDITMSALGQSETLANFYKDETNYGINSDNELAGTTWVSTYYNEVDTLKFNEDGKTFSLSIDNWYTYIGYYRYANGEGTLFVDEYANEHLAPPMPVIWPWGFRLTGNSMLNVDVPFADDGIIPNFIKQ